MHYGIIVNGLILGSVFDTAFMSRMMNRPFSNSIMEEGPNKAELVLNFRPDVFDMKIKSVVYAGYKGGLPQKL
jgi:hypothetical protein